jgi:hypothetical protein
MDIYLAKHLYDTQISKLVNNNKDSNKFIVEKLEDAPSSSGSTGGSTGGSNASSISSCVVFLVIASTAAYLSWKYTSEHNIEPGMKVIYAITAFNCGLCFICFYLCFATKK